MQYTIEELRQRIYSKVYEVYGIFKDYFGEDKVDLQNIPNDVDMKVRLEEAGISTEGNPDSYEITDGQLNHIPELTGRSFILVWWPEVTVTNEHDRSVVIQDLYAKIEITLEGRIPYENRGFQLNRTTFPAKQFGEGYCHSHVPHFERVPHFCNPCLGSGPINNTILNLKNDYDIMSWMMFCRELSMYVTVESLRGVPYNYLERIGKKEGGRLYKYQNYDWTTPNISKYYDSSEEESFFGMIREFSSYYLQHGHLKFGFDVNTFTSGMPFYDFIIDISNAFISFFNEFGDKTMIDRLYDRNIVKTVNTADGIFYEPTGVSRGDRIKYEGTHMLDFKGEPKLLHILPDEEDVEHTTLLNKDIAMYILQHIINILNYRYKNEHNNKSQDDSTTTDSAGKASASACQRVYYI